MVLSNISQRYYYQRPGTILAQSIQQKYIEHDEGSGIRENANMNKTWILSEASWSDLGHSIPTSVHKIGAIYIFF